FRRTHKFGAASIHHITEIGELATAIIEASQTRRALTATHSGGEDNLFAHLHGCDFGTDLGYLTRNVATWNVRQRNRDIRQATANPQIQVIQGASSDANENLPAAERRLGRVGILQNFGSTMLFKNDRFHLGFALCEDYPEPRALRVGVKLRATGQLYTRP